MNASDEAAGEWRTMSEACSANAMASSYPIEVLIEDRVVAAGEVDLVVEGGNGVGFTGHRAQDVERDDVARPLPHGHDGLLTVATGKREVLGVTVAAQALEGFVGVVRAALADPVLRNSRRESAERLFLLIRVLVLRTSQSQCGDGRGFGFESQIGKHRGHRRLICQDGTESAAVPCVPHRFGDRLTHTCRAAEDAVESRLGHHFDDGPHATT